MSLFDEIIRKIETIHELISLKIRCDEEQSQYLIAYSNHLYEIKCWYVRLSYHNKKRFFHEIINEIGNIWTITVLLKSIWSCRPKDAILSANQYKTWSSYDQVPMDHNRALDLPTLEEAMTNSREWFHSLKSEKQCLVIADLLSISGGPIMWDILQTLEKIYERYKGLELENLIDCLVINELVPEKKAAVVEIKKEQTPRRKSSVTQGLETKLPFDNGQAQKELETNLAQWTSTVKYIKDNSKLEEVEMTFKDGTKKRVWRANRTKSDTFDTVDLIQLLPSAIGKRILFYLSAQQLVDCARVNKYWAYLVEEFRAELIARQKIDAELAKLRENMLHHDINLGLLTKPTIEENSVLTALKKENFGALDKSCAYGFKSSLKRDKIRPKIVNLPFRNMTDLNERLERRGAADENLSKWCTNVSKAIKKYEENKASS